MSNVRFPAIPREKMSAEQVALYDKIATGPRAGVRGPYNALLRNPELCSLSEQLGAYVRYRNSLPNALKEFAILITARHWTAQYEWYAHRMIGEKEGLSKELCDTLARGEKPKMDADQSIIYDFTTQMLKKHEVDDPTYARMKDRFGERGVLDLIYLVGHYCTVAFILNIDRHPLPPDATPLPNL